MRIRQRPRKQKRTLKQLHADLIALGFDGSYSRVAAFARDWKENRQREQQTVGRDAFVPLAFQPGEAFQFDWSEDWAVIGGERIKLQVAHIKLSYSRAFLVRAYLLQTHEMLFDAHAQAFRVFGGVPRRGIFDNMKIGQLTALAFAAAVDDPERFKRSRDIGACFGLVPLRYQSGEVDYTGSISKCGDRRVRRLLYEAANVILTRRKGPLKLKYWAFAIARRSTMRKARIALARRLAIIMHAMLKHGTEFKLA